MSGAVVKGCFYCTNDMFFKRDVKLLICEKLNSDASIEASGSILPAQWQWPGGHCYVDWFVLWKHGWMFVPFPIIGSADGQEMQILIQYITACFPNIFFWKVISIWGGKWVKQNHSSQGGCLTAYLLYNSQLHVVQVVRYPKLLGESGLKESRF